MKSAYSSVLLGVALFIVPAFAPKGYGDFLPGQTIVLRTTDSPFIPPDVFVTATNTNFAGRDSGGNVRFSGSLTSFVFRDTITGNLSFEYRLSNAGPENILSLAISGFANQRILGAVNRLIDAPEGYIADKASRSAGEGTTITFLDYRFRHFDGMQDPISGFSRE
jgi:hypothetical protein